LLNSHQGFALGYLFEIRKQSALKEGEELDSEPEERSVTIIVLIEGLEHIEAGIKVSEVFSSQQQQAATTR
jgi:hypothetical protein